MRYVQATMRTYDAEVGALMVGETYYIEDAKAERWVNAGIATLTEAPRRTQPEPEPEPEPEPAPEPEPPPPQPAEEEEDEGEDNAEEDDAELAGEVRKLHEAGDSQRMIADRLGISRATVRRLLAA